MVITKELMIQEVKAARISNAPYEIVLESARLFEREKRSSLTFDANACARHGIPMSLDLVGRTLICSFESRKLRTKNESFMSRRLLEQDLCMESLVREEETSLLSYTVPPSKKLVISQTLELKTYACGGRYSTLPCPLYHFFLDLTDKEYRTCKALSATTVFRPSFSLKVGETENEPEPEDEIEYEQGAS